MQIRFTTFSCLAACRNLLFRYLKPNHKTIVVRSWQENVRGCLRVNALNNQKVRR